jgi:hypothetical protein
VRLWNLVLEAELAVKSGERGEEQALETLVAGLVGVFAPKSSGSVPRTGRAPSRGRPQQ